MTDRDDLPGAVSLGASTLGATTLGDRGRFREQALVAGEPDAVARAERTLFDEGRTSAELKDAALRGEARRQERFREAFEWLILGVVLLGGLALFAVAAAYVAHLLLPEGAQWLTEDQLDDLRNVLTGSVVAIVVTQIKKRLD